MKLLKDKISRLAIYFFYDNDGIVDGFIEYFIKEILKCTDRLVIVCNGKLSEDGEHKLSGFTREIIVRENKGFDVWAYKAALEYIGWDMCRQYDEVILCNSTSMGPVYPFENMFQEMAERNVDFWGITKTHTVKEFDFGCNPYGYLPEHIQSYFIVYRRSLIESPDLEEYWNKMPQIESYNQSIGLYESVFTKYFADKGYLWDVYVNTDDYEGVTDQPLMHYPENLIRERKCPIFKRRTFFHSYRDVLEHTAGQSALLLYNFLVESQLYDVNLIWDNLLRCYNLVDVSRQMHLNYTLSSQQSTHKFENEIKTALIACLYSDKKIEDSLHWIKSMPDSSDLIIVTDAESKEEKIYKLIEKIPFKRKTIMVMPNKGRDMGVLLVGMREQIRNYELVCFFHDNEETLYCPGSIGQSFMYSCLANVLFNKIYVENLIKLFLDNERLGLAVPPPPIHGRYRDMYGEGWEGNYKNTKILCSKLGINVPMDEKKAPIMPFGNIFWFRPSAIKKILDYNWSYSDFPKRNLTDSGSIYQAIKRMYSLAAQDTKFYSAIVMNDVYSRIEYTNLDFEIVDDQLVKKLNRQLTDIYESTSWKVSRPIRVIGEIVKNVLKT